MYGQGLRLCPYIFCLRNRLKEPYHGRTRTKRGHDMENSSWSPLGRVWFARRQSTMRRDLKKRVCHITQRCPGAPIRAVSVFRPCASVLEAVAVAVSVVVRQLLQRGHRRRLPPPLRRLLIRVRQLDQPRFVERAAEQLQSRGQRVVSGVAHGDGDRRHPCRG